jgi:hypothetical protein
MVELYKSLMYEYNLKLSRGINTLKSSVEININPDDGDGGDLRNVGFQLNIDTVDLPRRF